MRFGVSLIIIAGILWIASPIQIFFGNSQPEPGLFFAAITIGVIGGVLILIGVVKDRYQEYKEDQKNDDYRKY